MKAIYVLLAMLLVSNCVAGLSIDVHKSVDKTTIEPGERLNYTLYYNITQNVADVVYLNDTLSDSVSFLSCSPSYTNLSGGIVSWLFTNVSIGNYKIFLNVTVDSGAEGEIENNFTLEICSFVTNSTWDTTGDWDSGTKNNITTETDRYNQSAGCIELDFPYASKDNYLKNYWRLEANATNEPDETGNETASRATGSHEPTYNESGIYGGCYYFYDDALICGSGTDFYFNDGESFSLCAWFNSDVVSYSTLGIICGMYRSGYDLYELLIQMDGNNNVIEFHLRDGISGGGSTHTIAVDSIDTGYNDGLWHLAVGTFDGTDNSSLYVDGVYQDSVISDVNDIDPVFNDFMVGTRDDAYNRNFHGSIDEVKIYRGKCLNLSEIVKMYNDKKKYVVSGDFASNCSYLWVAQKATNETIHYINISMSNGDDNHYIDKIEILDCSTNDTITTCNTNISSNITLNDTYFDLGLEDTDTDVKFRLYLVGNGSSTISVDYIEIKTAPFNISISRTSNTISVLSIYIEPEETSLFDQLLPIILLGIVIAIVYKMFLLLKNSFKSARGAG